MTQPTLLAITSGEPAGIGPDLCNRLAWQESGRAFVVLADRDVLQQRAAMLGLDIRWHDYDPHQCSLLPPGHLRVLHVPAPRPVQALTRTTARMSSTCWCVPCRVARPGNFQAWLPYRCIRA